MFRLTIGNTTDRRTVTYALNKTPREALTEYKINFGKGAIHLNGANLTAADLDKTFEQLNVTDAATLTVTIKADAAA